MSKTAIIYSFNTKKTGKIATQVGKALAIALKNGPSNYDLNFKFTNRNNPKLLSELGRLLLNISSLHSKISLNFSIIDLFML